MNQQEQLCAMALTRVAHLSLATLLELFRRAGSATAVVAHARNIRDLLPDASDRLVASFADMSDPMRRAESELRDAERMGTQILVMGSGHYPTRLAECADAPLVLFYRGEANLNQARVVSIVGTRHATPYGIDLVRRFMADLRELAGPVLVVSGLAYGIDIAAHRQALACGFETVGVLAHGLDDLYPYAHRQTAETMTHHGGLVSEYMLGTRADKVNFVRRNRLVAGMADATVLVESAARGGGLITTGLARDYGREVFAFPGAVGAQFSEGCNQLIRDCGAGLITSGADFVAAMGWAENRQADATRQKGIERQLFPELSDEEQRVVDLLSQQNDLQAGVLSVRSGIAVGRLTALVFSLEMKGVVRQLAGGVVHLLA